VRGRAYSFILPILVSEADRTRIHPLLLGHLSLSLFTVESLEQAEDHLIIAAITDAGQPLDEEAAHRLFSLPGQLVTSPLPLGEGKGEGDSIPLKTITQQRQESIQRTTSERNDRFFDAEADKLDDWAEDIKLGLEREIKDMDRQIREVRREATSALTLEEKLAGQKKLRTLEAQRSEKRRSLFDAQDKSGQTARRVHRRDRRKTHTGNKD